MQDLKMSEIEKKFYEVKVKEKKFVIIPTESERKFLNFVRTVNSFGDSLEEARILQEYCSNITMGELAEIRIVMDNVNSAWNLMNTKQITMNLIEEKK